MTGEAGADTALMGDAAPDAQDDLGTLAGQELFWAHMKHETFPGRREQFDAFYDGMQALRDVVHPAVYVRVITDVMKHVYPDDRP